MAEVDVRAAYVNLGQGMLVERDVLDIARRVSEYDPNLKVQFLNDAAAGVGEPPYRIVEMCRDNIERPVFSVWVLDEKVLQRLYAADNQKFDVLGVLDRNNAKAKAREKSRYRDRMDEAHEVTKTVLRSPKDTFSVPASVLDPNAGSDKKVVFRAAPGEYGPTDRK